MFHHENTRIYGSGFKKEHFYCQCFDEKFLMSDGDMKCKVYPIVNKVKL